VIAAVLRLLAANALLLPLGAGILAAVGTWDRCRWGTRAAITPFTGQAAFVALVPPLLYAGLAPTVLVVAILSLAGLGAGFAVRSRRRRPAPEPDASGGGVLAAALLAGPFLVLMAAAAVQPLRATDAFADWALKAKMLYSHGGLFTGAIDSRVLGEGAYRFTHPEYPLGIPSLEAFGFHAMGEVNAQVVHVQFVLLFGAFLAAAWALLRPRVDPVVLAAGLGATLLLPDLRTQLLSAYADVPLACFWVASAVAMALWLAGDGPDRLALATLFAAAALGTKGEGIVFTVVLLALAAAALLLQRRPRALRSFGIAAGLCVLAALPWQLYLHRHGLSDRDISPSITRMAHQTDNISLAVRKLTPLLLSGRWMATVPLAVGAAALVLVRRRRLDAAAGYLAVLVAVMAGLVTVYWTAVTPARTLLSTSAHRVVVTPVLLSAIALPVLLDRGLDGAEDVLARAWGTLRGVATRR
jgi:hypothetical protein